MDEAELELFEVAQATVDEFAGPAGRPGREIACLDERDRESPGGGIERRTDTGDAAADDQDVEALPAQSFEVRGAPRRGQCTGGKARNRGISSHDVHGSAARPVAAADATYGVAHECAGGWR